MWRKISKVALKYVLILGIIGAICVSGLCFGGAGYAMIMGCVIVPLQVFITALVACCFLGMAIEVCENVAEMKDILKQNQQNNDDSKK